MSLNRCCRAWQKCQNFLFCTYPESSCLYSSSRTTKRYWSKVYTERNATASPRDERCVFATNGATANIRFHQKVFLQSSGLQCHAQDRRYLSSESARSTSIDAEEVEKFSRIAQHWWNESGEFAALHTLNELRISMIRDGLIEPGAAQSSLPLKGFKILDVGCGGGILSEPLTRLGADVTGLDASQENITVASQHAANDPALTGRLRYLCMPIEDLKLHEATQYDAVVLSEILEHVNDVRSFVETCCVLVKTGGSLFVTTINKTTLSYLLAVVAAERIFRIVPVGAHDWNKFVSPQELQQTLGQNSFSTRLIHGMTLNPLSNNWSWTRDTSVNYAFHAVKTDHSERDGN